VTPDNRLIAWPYTKLMVANPLVNQGAAVLVTSLATARAAGIDPAAMIYLIGGAAADEPRDYVARDGYAASPAQDAVLARALDLDMHAWWAPTAAGYFDHVSKAKALEAVSAFAPDQVTRLSKLKKRDLAAEAERLSAGKGWLPAMLCAVPADEQEADASEKEIGGHRRSRVDSTGDNE